MGSPTIYIHLRVRRWTITARSIKAQPPPPQVLYTDPFHECRAAPVTDILQWLTCCAAMVGVLLKAYPSMMPEFMSYQATIIKCVRDFDGLAWAQYDRAYHQVAQTKELHWSKPNPTLYSLCFAGKARCYIIVCSFCLSNNHSSDQCPENPNMPSAAFTLYHSQPGPGPTFTGAPRLEKLCNQFNSKEGPRCNYRNCKFAHKRSACRDTHTRAYCRSTEVTEARGSKWEPGGCGQSSKDGIEFLSIAPGPKTVVVIVSC